MTKKEADQLRENEDTEKRLHQNSIEINDLKIEKNSISNELAGMKARGQVVRDEMKKINDQLKEKTHQISSLIEKNESLEVICIHMYSL